MHSTSPSHAPRRPLRAIPRLLPIGAVALAVSLLPAVAAPTAQAVPPSGVKGAAHGAKVTVNRTKLRAGSKLRVTGRGWKTKGSRLGGGKVVTVKLDDRDILATFRVRKGRFSGTIVMPRAVRAGRHWLRFLAASPATSIRSKTFRVTR